MPGFTHLKVAQPVTFGTSFAWPMSRCWHAPRGGFADCRRRPQRKARSAPGALAGHQFSHRPGRPRPPRSASRAHGNSMDAVSARDFAIEFLAAGPSSPPNLSRFRRGAGTLGPAKAFRSCLGDALPPGKARSCPEAQPRCGRAGARQGGTGHRGAWCSCSCAEGLPLTMEGQQEDKETVFLDGDNLSPPSAPWPAWSAI